MTDKLPTIQEVYAQIKGNPGAYAELMSLPDHDALVDRLVQICHEAGRTDMTAAEMTRFLDRDLGDVLHGLNGEDELTDEELECVAAGGGAQSNVGLRSRKIDIQASALRPDKLWILNDGRPKHRRLV